MKERKVEIKTDGTSGGTQIYIDGKKQKNVIAINFNIKAGGLGDLTLRTTLDEIHFTGKLIKKK